MWSVTTDPLEPDLYGYSFVADGVSLIDPANPAMKPNPLNTQSVVHVPGPASLPREINNLPHGVAIWLSSRHSCSDRRDPRISLRFAVRSNRLLFQKTAN